MPVINIPKSEFALNAFYSLHRPLLELPTPQAFKAGKLVGQIKKEEDSTEEALFNHMESLRPFEPPAVPVNSDIPTIATTTLTVEIDPSYLLQHNNNHEEIADYLTAIQKELDTLYSKNSKKTLNKKRLRKLSNIPGFFEKN